MKHDPELPLGPQDVGERLEEFLDRLSAAGLATSPRDRINAMRLAAALVAKGEVRDVRDLKPRLAVLLARSPYERERYFSLFDEVAPPIETSNTSDAGGEKAPLWNPLEALRNGWERTRPVLPRMILALAAAAVIPAVWYYFTKPPDVVEIPEAETERELVRPSVGVTPAARGSVTDDAVLKRIADAAERFEDAPTIDELSSEIAKASTISWPAASYAIRLSELSGLPRSVPLALYGADGKDGRIWARLALALHRIEQPGTEPPFAALRDKAQAALVSSSATRPVYSLATKLRSWYSVAADIPKDHASLVENIQRRNHVEATRAGTPSATADLPDIKSISPGDRLDPQTIERALAIAGPEFFSRTSPEAPWLPRHAATGASFAPWWTPWLAATLPLAIALLWLSRSLALRRAYLRRRPPDLPPLHTKLVADAGKRARFDAVKLQKIAQRLRTRTARSTTQLDIAASIGATLRAGGEIPSPVFAVERHNPEYLVLIERRSERDQDAERMRALVRRLEAMLPVTVYYYRSEPSHLEPEDGGRALAIEQLEARYPEHRLIILGSGAGFLDPFTLKPLPSVERLAHWSRRALLTPIGLSEWGSEELDLARELRLPIGRATVEGMEALAKMLGLDGAELETLTEGHGDNFARPLPLGMRIRPERYLYSAPPYGEPVAEIVRQLRNFLDGRAFEWLCALAVYPAVQWDLTLYLGVTLPEQPGSGSAAADTHLAVASPLYSEERLAALTQLPWLREGQMPNWLRTALISELSEVRREEVRRALTALIANARVDRSAGLDTVEMTIAREKERVAQEALKDRLPPERLLEDQVLLDFLAEGKQEDLEITGARWLDSQLVKSWIKRFGLPEAATIGVALAYAAAAVFVAPSASDGALVAGAWLPIILLGAGFLLALAFADREPSYVLFRRSILGLAAPAAAFAALMLTALAVYGFKLNVPGVFGAGTFGWLVLPALGVISLAFSRRAATFAGVSIRAPEATWLGRLAAFSCQAVAVIVAAAYTHVWIIPLNSSAPRHTAYLTAAASGLGVFLLAWVMSKALPEKLPKPKSVVRGAHTGSTGVAFRMGLAALPIAPAVLLALYVASSSRMLDEPVLGGVTAMAELPGGDLMAIGGADGNIRVVKVTDGTVLNAVPGKGIAVSHLSLGDALGAVSTTSADGTVSVTPLSLVRTVVVSYADGTIAAHPAYPGATMNVPILPDISGSPSRIHTALTRNGAALVANEDESGKVSIEWSSLAAPSKINTSDLGLITAVAAAGDDGALIATLDGRVHLVSSLGVTSRPVAASTSCQEGLGTAIRRLSFDPASRSVTAYGIDGSVLTLPVTADGFDSANSRRSKIDTMSLGPPVPSKCAIAPSPTPSERKLEALVIGNAAYSANFALRNAANDARMAATALYALGFAVTESFNLKREDFVAELQRFQNNAKNADVALVYFAGHAYASGGENRLVPIDVGGTRAEAARAIPESQILAAAAPARLKIVVVDSHDNKQLPKEPKEDEENTRSLGRDDQFEPDLPANRTLPPDSVVIYAAGEGTEALDSVDRKARNSPFTTALADALRQPAASIPDLFGAVQREVQKATNGRQKPVIYAQLSQPFTMTGGLLTEPGISPEEDDSIAKAATQGEDEKSTTQSDEEGKRLGRTYQDDAMLSRFALPAGEQDRLSDVRLPVLQFSVPPDIVLGNSPAYQAQQTIYADQGNPVWYRIVDDYGDVATSVHGDIRSWDDEDGKTLRFRAKPAETVDANDVNVTTERNADGEPITVARAMIRSFGVPYSVSLRCRSPAAIICEDKARFARDLRLLKVVGGEPSVERGTQDPEVPAENAEGTTPELGPSGPEPTPAELRAALLALDQSEIVAALENGVVDPNASLDGDGNGMLHVLLEVCTINPAHDQARLAELARTLIESGATPNLNNRFGDSPSSIAKAPKFCGSEHPVNAVLSGDPQPKRETSFEREDGLITPPRYEDLRDEYNRLFETAEIREDKLTSVREYIDRLFKGRLRYLEVERATGVPWYVAGLIHGLEAGFNFRVHLHNGDSLEKRTVNFPANRPSEGEPPFTWEESAIDQLRMTRFNEEANWTVPQVLFRLEGYNGWRSRVLHRINTPYLWSFTQHYTKGKYVADGVWDPEAVPNVPGAAAQLKLLFADPRFEELEEPLGASRSFGGASR